MRANNLLQLIQQITIEFRFRKPLRMKDLSRTWQQNLGRRFGTSKMHLSPPVA